MRKVRFATSKRHRINVDDAKCVYKDQQQSFRPLVNSISSRLIISQQLFRTCETTTIRLRQDFGIGARGQKTRVLGLSDGRKSFKIGLAV